MPYSQNNEEPVIVEFFDNCGVQPGRFMDIGAYDGKAFSNTYRLVELGWGGVCVEPSPSVFPALIKLHGDNPNIELLNAAVGAQAAFVDFYDSGGDAISSTSIRHVQKWQRGWNVNYKRFIVYMVPLRDLFLRFGFQFEFINLDVEDANWQLFELLPLEALTATRVICVEHDNEIERMTEVASKWGFKAIFQNGENLILAR